MMEFFVGLKAKSAYGGNGRVNGVQMVEEIIMACDSSNISAELKSWPLNELLGGIRVVLGVIDFCLASFPVCSPLSRPSCHYHFLHGSLEIGGGYGNSERVWKFRTSLG